MNQKAKVENENLKILYPNLAKEWNYVKNGELLPTDVSKGSHLKVWWTCKNGHEWECIVKDRVRGNGCPYCSNRKLLLGVNDLATTHPHLLIEWNYEKNLIHPTDVTISSIKKVWWKCQRGHEWEGQVRYRQKSGCPICAKELRTSFPEQAIYYYIKQLYPNAISGDREQLDPLELDIYIPDLNLAIEYDGSYWHKNASRDLEKDKLCKEKGIILYRVRETKEQEDIKDKNIFYCRPKDNKQLESIIREIVLIINSGICEINIDINRDTINIYNQFIASEKANSIEVKAPELAEEWNFEKNGNLKPNMVGCGSDKKIWWKCSKNHEWKESVSNRIKGRGCPYCSNRRVLVGYNDLATTDKLLLSEWNYDKNTILPTELTKSNGKMVWWKCSICGCEWKTSPNHRTSGKGTGCPRCGKEKSNISHTQTLVDKNGSLADRKPELLAEWNYKKNKISPYKITLKSNKKVWWICSKGHEWEISPSNKKECPYCSGYAVIEGETDLFTKYPQLISEWNYKKNEIDPKNLSANSQKKVWWVCKKGHEWEAIISNRTSKGSGCPYCSNHKVLAGYNDLATTNPELLDEWDYNKNEIKPTEVTNGSSKKIWWKCRKCNKEWQTIINLRGKGSGCPSCSKKKIIKYNN